MKLNPSRPSTRANKEKALMAAGEAAQRINDMPRVADMVEKIAKEAEETLRGIQAKHLA